VRVALEETTVVPAPEVQVAQVAATMRAVAVAVAVLALL
jgi:hypothetical protein